VNISDRELRKRIRGCFPDSLVIPAQKFARGVDQLCGLPLSAKRKGSVLMIHVGRCGSTVIGNMLDQHPDIYWDGEIYHTKWRYNGFKFRDFDSEKFIKRQMVVSGKRYYGFELKPLADQHLAIVKKNMEEFLDEMKRCGVTHYIVLERKNYLRRMISQYAGTKSNVRHIEGAQSILTQVSINPDAVSFGHVSDTKPLLECFDEIRDVYAQTLQLLGPERVLQLHYEDDILNKGPFIAYARICDFLGVEQMNPPVKLSVTNPFRVSDMIYNYDEIKEVMTGTPYEWMLEE